MRLSRWLLAATMLAPGLCALALPVQAQQVLIVPTCDSATLPANTGYGPLTMTPKGVLCTNAAGGGGGGAATIADGADVTQGAIADAAATAGGTGTLSAKLRNATALLNSILTSVSAAIPAGTAVIGKVGIDQTTPGTTNLVALAANQSVNEAQINGVTPLMGNGVTGTGSQRVTVASDNTPFATKIDQTTPGTTNAVTTSPNARTIVTLDVKTVTTGGTAVAALTAGHKTAGGWIQNPSNATINLCINEIGTATGTTSSGDTTCIIPGQTYNLIPSGGAVSVISSDSSHPFAGYGLN
jgi:hypothetical protein